MKKKKTWWSMWKSKRRNVSLFRIWFQYANIQKRKIDRYHKINWKMIRVSSQWSWFDYIKKNMINLRKGIFFEILNKNMISLWKQKIFNELKKKLVKITSYIWYIHNFIIWYICIYRYTYILFSSYIIIILYFSRLSRSYIL